MPELMSFEETVEEFFQYRFPAVLRRKFVAAEAADLGARYAGIGPRRTHPNGRRRGAP
jgi:hypothetical protein